MKMFRVVVNGNEYKVGIEELAAETAAPQPAAARPAPRPAAPTPAPKPQPAPVKSEPAAGSGGVIRAPMPGTVLRVDVSKGDTVTRGQTLLVLEAMKMENEIQAPADGVVADLQVVPGASVNAGDVLVALTA